MKRRWNISRWLERFFFKIYTRGIHLFNLCLLTGAIFFIKLLLKWNKKRFALKLWEFILRLVVKQDNQHFNRIVFSLKGFLHFFFSFFLVLFFSIICYLVIIIILEEFSFNIYACNKALLFFFLSFGIFLLFNKSNNSFFYDPIEDGELESGLTEDEAIEEGDEDYIEGEEEVNAESSYEDANHEDRLNYLFIQTSDEDRSRLFNLLFDGEYDDEESYEVDYLDGLNFFEKWYDLSNEIVIRLFVNNGLKHNNSSIELELINNKNLNLLALLDSETGHLLGTKYNFSELDNYSDLLRFFVMLESNDSDISETIWLGLQVDQVEWERFYENIYQAIEQNPNVNSQRTFFNKYNIVQSNKISYVSYQSLVDNFFMDLNKSNLVFEKIPPLNSYFNGKLDFNYLRLTNSEVLLKDFISDTRIESLNNMVCFQDFAKLKIEDLSFYDKYLKFFQSEYTDYFVSKEGEEIKKFISFFFRLILQERFDEKEKGKLNLNLLNFSFRKNSLEFFISTYLQTLPIFFRFVFFQFFFNFIKILPFNFTKEQINKLINLKRENELILFIFMWQSFLTDFAGNYSNGEQFNDLYKYFLRGTYDVKYRKDFFFNFNTDKQNEDELLLDEQLKTNFDDKFVHEDMYFSFLNEKVLQFHNFNAYNKQSIYWKNFGNYEFFHQLPFSDLESELNFSSLKSKYFRVDQRQKYLKKRKFLEFVFYKKDKGITRIRKVGLFFFFRLVFGIFEFKYWVLRFFPFVFESINTYGFGGTLINYNYDLFLLVYKYMMNFGFHESKSSFDYNLMISSLFDYSNPSEIEIILLNSKEQKPDILYANLNKKNYFLLNTLYQINIEIDFLFFVTFLKKQVLYNKPFISKFYARENFFENLLFEKKNSLSTGFDELIDKLIGKHKLIVRKKLKIKPKKLRIRFYWRTSFQLREKILKKKQRKLVQKKRNLYKKWLKLLVKRSARRKYIQRPFLYKLNDKEKELLGIFFQKFWTNEYNEIEYEDEIVSRDSDLDEALGGIYSVDDNGELIDGFYYYDIIWDWQATNWESLISLFYDVDRYHNTNDIRRIDEDDEGIYYFVFLIGLFFWLYCRMWKFLNFNDSDLKPFILKYTRQDRSVSVFKMFFENFVHSTGRNRLLGENYVGDERRFFQPFVSTSSFYWCLSTPIMQSVKDLDTVLSLKSQFSLRKLKSETFYRDETFQTHISYGKGFGTIGQIRYFRYFILKWMLYSNLKRSLNPFTRKVTKQEKAIELASLKDFLVLNRRYGRELVFYQRKHKVRKFIDRLKTFPYLRTKYLIHYLGYDPNKTGPVKDLDKYNDNLYRNFITRKAKLNNVTSYDYESIFGSEEIEGNLRRNLENVMYANEQYSLYEERLNRVIGEHLFFNLLKKNYRDEHKKPHFTGHLADLFLDGVYGSLMRNYVQYRYNVRKKYKRSVLKLPTIVNFLVALPENRRNDFLQKAGLAEFFYKNLFEFLLDDFVVYNNNKKALKNEKDTYDNFVKWYQSIYIRPFSFISVSDKNKYFRDFFGVTNESVLLDFFLNLIGDESEDWFYWNIFDFDIKEFVQLFRGEPIDLMPFLDTLNYERLSHFFDKIENNNVKKTVMKELLKRFKFFDYSLWDRFIHGQRVEDHIVDLVTAKVVSSYTEKNETFPIRRSSFFEQSLNQIFRKKGFKVDKRFFTNDLLEISEVKRSLRNVRKKSNKRFFFEGVFNLGRQFVDFHEMESGYNRTFDYSLSTSGGDVLSRLDDFFESKSGSTSYKWYLGNNDLMSDLRRSTWHLPTWIWAYMLRRSMGIKNTELPDFMIENSIMPALKKTQKSVIKGQYFYNHRFINSTPLNFTFEESFPSEEGYIGIILLTSIFKFILYPFFFIWGYLNSLISFFLPNEIRYGDANRRPIWLRQMDEYNLQQIRSYVIKDHIGKEMFPYVKFDAHVPSEIFFDNFKQTLFFKIIDRFWYCNFFSYPNEKEKFLQYSYSKEDNEANNLYLPIKNIFLFRAKTTQFNVIFLYLFGYLFFYFFVWVPGQYIYYSLNQWYDDTEGRDVAMEELLDFQEETLMELFYLKDSNEPNWANYRVSDYGFRSGSVNIDTDMFSYLVTVFSFFDYHHPEIFENIHYKGLNDAVLLFYGKVVFNMLRSEFYDFYLLRLYSYDDLSFNLFDVYHIAEEHYIRDKLKNPIPENRSIFNEFITLLFGNIDTAYTDLYEEYLNSLKKGKHKKEFFSKNSQDKKFLFKKQKGLYLGDGVYIESKRRTRKRINAVSSFDKEHFDLFLEKKTNEGTFNLNDLTLRYNLWANIQYFEESLKIMNFNKFIFVNTERVHVHSEFSSSYLMYINELLSILPFGNMGYLKEGNVFERRFGSQYLPMEQLFPFYFRFIRSDNIELKEITSSYNSIYFDNVDRLMANFFQTKNKPAEMQNLFDVKDVGFVEPFSIEGSLSVEGTVGMFYNLKNYLNEVVAKENYFFTDNYIIEEHSSEIYSLFSNELMDELRESEFDTLDWSLIIEQARDWMLFYSQEKFFRVELEDDNDGNANLISYYMDENNLTKERIDNLLTPFKLTDKYLTKKMFNLLWYEYYFKRKFNWMMSFLFARSMVYNQKYSDFKFEDEVEVRPFISIEEEEETIEEIPFPDQYTTFSKYFKTYQTDFFSGFYFDRNLFFKPFFFKKNFSTDLNNNLFIHFYLLNFISRNVIFDLDQKFVNNTNSLNTKFSQLGTNQYVYYSVIQSFSYESLVLSQFSYQFEFSKLKKSSFKKFPNRKYSVFFKFTLRSKLVFSILMSLIFFYFIGCF